jgi:hypothetical protein
MIETAETGYRPAATIVVFVTSFTDLRASDPIASQAHHGRKLEDHGK